MKDQIQRVRLLFTVIKQSVSSIPKLTRETILFSKRTNLVVTTAKVHSVKLNIDQCLHRLRLLRNDFTRFKSQYFVLTAIKFRKSSCWVVVSFKVVSTTKDVNIARIKTGLELL